MAVALFAVAFSACEKKNHKILASKVDPTLWSIDEMSFSYSTGGDSCVLVHDTVLQEAGHFEFLHDKNRHQHGTGTLYRREYVGGAWGIETQQQFIWSVDGDDLKITYQDGVEEDIDIIESKRKVQRWNSRTNANGTITDRTYFLSKDLGES